MDYEKRGRGRPKKDDAKSNTVLVRLDDVDYSVLQHFTNETGKSQSEIFREALRYYNYAMKK